MERAEEWTEKVMAGDATEEQRKAEARAEWNGQCHSEHIKRRTGPIL